MARTDALKGEVGPLYADLEHRAIRALKDERVASALRARYRYVFVDEYQDVSDVQEPSTRPSGPRTAFHGGRRQQSIYRFRRPTPPVPGKIPPFQARRRRPAGTRAEAELSLPAAVLSWSTGCSRGDDRRRRESSTTMPRASGPARTSRATTCPQLHILERPTPRRNRGGELTGGEREGQTIAARIQSLVGTPYFRRAEGLRATVEYRDLWCWRAPRPHPGGTVEPC